MAAKEKILVVDDEPSIRKYLQTLLEVDGFDVHTVSSGKEALAKVNAGERPDFIILDVLMPELNGLDTLKELMQLDRSLNVIMLSCSNEVGTVVEAIRIGAHDYLTKPFEKSELDAAMLKSRRKNQLTQENQALRDYCDQVTEDLSFLAASPQMVRIRQQILQIAPEKASHPGESSAARLLRSGHRGSQLPRSQPADGSHPPANFANRTGRCSGVHLRRKRRGKRSCFPNDSPAIKKTQSAVCKSELRGPAGRTARIGAVWI